MKLSEPQKRVLRELLDYDCVIHVDTYHANSLGGSPRIVGGGIGHRVSMRTLQALETRDLLERGSRTTFSFRYILTPKGHKIAKELQNAKAD